MSITGAFILPHPPLIVPNVGQGRQREIQSTIDACHEAARRIAALRPDTIVLISPHAVLYADYFHMSPGGSANGDMGSFGARQTKFTAQYDQNLVKILSELAQRAGLPAGTKGERDPSLDHGSMVPLYFVNQYYTNYKLVRVSLSGLSPVDHYRLGICVAEAADILGGNVVLLASGDLSHKLQSDSPYGYAAEGPNFDSLVTNAMRDGDFGRFLDFEPSFLEKAAECGLRSFIIMAGALDRTAVKAELLSYEGPFGVGYAVASFMPAERDDTRAFLDQYLHKEQIRLQSVRDHEDGYVKLARYALEHFVRTGKRAKLPPNLPLDLTGRAAGVFISLKKHDELRSCIGTISPVTGSVAMEILRNAVSSASEDPRFDPVRPEELEELTYSVDVLSSPEQIESEKMLDVKRYGVIVTSGHKRGLLLPNLDGVDTIDQQLDIAKRKAGIRPGTPCKLERFEVVRHT